MRSTALGVLVIAFGLALGAGCSDDEPNLRFMLTDAPAPALQAVKVTITSVAVHQSASAGLNEGGWFEIPVTAAMPVDLLLLRGGVLMELCGVDLAEGSYQQVRLNLAPNEGSAPPFRNSVIDLAGAEFPLGVPVAGAKIAHGFTIDSGTRLDLVLDFDAAASVRQAPDGGWSMEPWITATSSRR